MMCGATCFLVTIEQEGTEKEKRVIARTPAKARRVIRKKIGPESKVISVRRQRN